jgi:hypothetical protein
VIETLDLPDDELGFPEHAAQRHNHRARIDETARYFRQERLVEHEVLGVHQDELVCGAAEMSLEVTGRVHPDVAATHDEDPCTHGAIVRRASLFAPIRPNVCSPSWACLIWLGAVRFVLLFHVGVELRF